MHRSFALLAPRGPRRTLAAVTLAASVSYGIQLSTAVFYATRVMRIPVMHAGFGVSIAGAACVAGSILAGRLSDRHGPVRVLYVDLIVAACVTALLPMVRGFPEYLVVLPLAAAAQASVRVLVAAIVNRIVQERANEFRGYIRSVMNVGLACGSGLSAVAVQMDAAWVYRTVIGIGAAGLAGAALIARRLPHLVPLQSVDAPRRVRWVVLRDRPYLALTLLDGVLSLQFRIQTIAIPLWIVGATTAPRWSIAIMDILNIVIVVLLQVRFSSKVVGAKAGGFAMRNAGVAFLVACVVLPMAHGYPGWIALPILMAGAAILGIGELWQTAGDFEASNQLAPPEAIGQYLGIFTIGLRLADFIGPVLLAWLCIDIGVVGWYVTGALLLTSGLLAPRVVAWAESSRACTPRVRADPVTASVDETRAE